jgi:hexosaminidase
MKYLILILLSLCSYSIDLSGQIIMPTPGKIERADGRLRLQGKIRMYAEESPGSFI